MNNERHCGITSLMAGMTQSISPRVFVRRELRYDGESNPTQEHASMGESLLELEIKVETFQPNGRHSASWQLRTNPYGENQMAKSRK
jgi:hypothetical protein